MEEWRDIPQYFGLYEASSEGRIRTKEGKTTSSARSDKRVWKQRILKQKYKKVNHRKDAVICLWKDGKPNYHLVSRLIASAFHGDNLKTKLTVNHIDGNPLNNKSENLEWMTLQENISYGMVNGQYRNIMKPVCVVSESGEEIYMRSASKLCDFLGRSKSYVQGRMKRGKITLYSSNGKEYHIIERKE